MSVDVGVGPPRVQWDPYPINPRTGANNQFSILIIYQGLPDRGIYFLSVWIKNLELRD